MAPWCAGGVRDGWKRGVMGGPCLSARAGGGGATQAGAGLCVKLGCSLRTALTRAASWAASFAGLRG
jgi:hypothetical protein